VLVRFKPGAQAAGLMLDTRYNRQGKRLTLAWPVAAILSDLFSKFDWAEQALRALAYLVARVAGALCHVLAQHGGDTVVLVGHDSVNRALLLQLLDQPLSAYWVLQQQPCGISEVVVDGTQVQVMRVNETAHLDRFD